VLEMGEPVRVLDIARDLIRLSGFRADEVPITFVGLRPGEKLDEELVGDDEVAGPSRVETIMEVQPRHAPCAATLWSRLIELEKAAIRGDADTAIALLRTIAPDFACPPITPMVAPVPGPQPVADPLTTDAAQSAFRRPLDEAALTCRSCGSESVHRSRVSGPIEGLRRHFTAKRPHRCYACGWRAWADVAVSPAAASVTAAALDLRPLDRMVPTATDTTSRAAMEAILSRLDAAYMGRP